MSGMLPAWGVCAPRWPTLLFDTGLVGPYNPAILGRAHSAEPARVWCGRLRAQAVSMQLAALYPALDGMLARVEAGIEQVWRREAGSPLAGTPSFLGRAAQRALSGRGKRLRPSILLLAAECAGGATEASIALASFVEVLHTASLVHDDVVDESGSRRGRRSANAMWGNKVSVLLGDFLIARAFGLLPPSESEWVSPLVAEAAARMCAGQVKEVRASGARLKEDEYVEIVRGKTGSLFALCGRAGARSAGGPAEVVESLAAFGERFGVAFQFADDILDLVGTNGKSGKPEGRDLAERKFTLPLIVASEVGGRAVRGRLHDILTKPAIGAQEVMAARELVESAGAIEPAWGRVREWLAAARRELAAVPESEAKRALIASCGELFPMPVMAALREAQGRPCETGEGHPERPSGPRGVPSGSQRGSRGAAGR